MQETSLSSCIVQDYTITSFTLSGDEAHGTLSKGALPRPGREGILGYVTSGRLLPRHLPRVAIDLWRRLAHGSGVVQNQPQSRKFALQYIPPKNKKGFGSAPRVHSGR
jgi:hypothetical protein